MCSVKCRIEQAPKASQYPVLCDEHSIHHAYDKGVRRCEGHPARHKALSVQHHKGNSRMYCIFVIVLTLKPSQDTLV